MTYGLLGGKYFDTHHLLRFLRNASEVSQELDLAYVWLLQLEIRRPKPSRLQSLFTVGNWWQLRSSGVHYMCKLNTHY